MKIAEGAPEVTHLLFADDSFLPFKAAVEEGKSSSVDSSKV